jgi:hypothetical protein
MKLTNVVFVVSSLAFPVSAHYKEKGSPLRKLAKKAGKKEGKKSSALSPVSPVVSTDSALSLLLTSDTYDTLAINSPQKWRSIGFWVKPVSPLFSNRTNPTNCSKC